jgi:protein involved in polysaccharide export with SLBB domain
MSKASIALLILLFSVFTTAQNAFSQTTTQGKTVNIDALTDAQILELLLQAKTAGLTDQQIIENAKTNGMPPAEAEKLASRIARIRTANSNTIDTTSARRLSSPTDSLLNPTTRAKLSGRLPIFGADLFANNNIRFEPNMTLATPVNYTVGPGDQLNISVYGLSQANWKLNVSPEGNINIPGTGVINVGGKSIQQATALIRSRLIATKYTIGNGTNLQVTLGDIRSIKVIMVGQLVRPGTYTLPSLATVFNALYSAGGPTANGSLRKIEIIRNNQIIRRLDVYDFLVKGNQKDNINLRDQDIIRVPTYDSRVEFSGEVKIPALFEVLPNETLQDLISFAGGFTDTAYTSRIKVSQIINQQRHITDILEQDFANYKPLRGDKFVAEGIVNRFDNRITILGAVFRPGNYELDNGLSLADLIAKAQGVKEDAFMERGTITRLRPDNTTELISFNVKNVINKQENITLQREDIIRIASIFDLRDQFQVTVTGEVRTPGTYAFAEKMKVEDLLLAAGGFNTGASTVRIEVARRVQNADPLSTSTAIATVFTINTSNNLSTGENNFELQPFDIVSVFSLPGYEKQRMVRIEGEVAYPGTYAIKNRDEKISDLVKRAGGLTALADINGATLRRENTLGTDGQRMNVNGVLQNRQSQIDRLNMATVGTAATNSLRNNYVGIDLKRILDKPGANIDLLLQADDVVSVPKSEQIVKVNGEVLFPSTVVYMKGKSVRDYINNAGSFSAMAWPKRPYVIYSNGAVKSTTKFLFFKSYPAVKPGSEIYVPQKPIRTRSTLQDVFGITGGLASIAAIIFGIISLNK